MGNKGDKLSNQATNFADSLVDQLDPIGDISSKKMFGGYGIFYKGKMFGMVDSRGRAYLKTDDTIKHHYDELKATKHNRMPYYEIPESILNNSDKLIGWAKRSIGIIKKGK